MEFNANIKMEATDAASADNKILVVTSMLQSVSDADFAKLAEKLRKNPKLFKKIVKYLPLI